MATKTKPSKKARHDAGRHSWTTAEQKAVKRQVDAGVKQGRSKQEMFKAIGEEMSKKLGVTIKSTNVETRYYMAPGAKTTNKPAATTRKRPAVEKAKARLKAEAAPKPRAKAKPRAKKPKVVTVDITPITPLEMVSAQISELEQRAQAAEARAEKAEKQVERLQSKLARVHSLTA